MSRSRIATALSLGCLLLLGATAAEASTITCESKGGAYRSCSVDTRERRAPLAPAQLAGLLAERHLGL